MKIGFSGAYSTGKTTLANFLSEELGIPVLTEPARDLINETGKRITDFEPESLALMQFLFAKRVMRSHIDSDSFVADATIADTLAYSTDIPEYPTLMKQAELCVKAMYDVVFYLPIEFPITDDGLRHTDDAFQSLIDAKIRKTHSDLKMECVTVRGSLEERKAAILNHLSRWK